MEGISLTPMEKTMLKKVIAETKGMAARSQVIFTKVELDQIAAAMIKFLAFCGDEIIEWMPTKK